MPSSIKHRTYIFYKVFAVALNFAYLFLIFTGVFSQQKSRLLFFDIIMPNTLLSFLLLSLWIEETSHNCSRFCTVFNTKIPTHFCLQATPFFSPASVFLSCYLIHLNIIISRDFFSIFVYTEWRQYMSFEYTDNK